MGEPTRRRCSECSLFSSRSTCRSPRTTWPMPSRSHSRMRNARDSPKPSRRRRERDCRRVEARGPRLLAGPFALRRATATTSVRTGDSRCAAGTHSPSPPASRVFMIAAVRGQIIARGADHVVIETNGVGYKVFVPRHPSRDEVLLHTHQVVREDDESLYGFETRDELALFEMLIGVSGVGPKAGMAILSVARPAEIASAIASGDAAALGRAPGVGKKTAERLIVDLKGKIGRVSGLPVTAGVLTAEDDAHAALVALGYTPSEAATALRDAPSKGSVTTEERLAAALRATGRTAVAGR